MGAITEGKRGRGRLTGSDVVPVRVVRSQLLEGTGLDGVDPVGDLRIDISNTARGKPSKGKPPRLTSSLPDRFK